jgi:DNA-binding winged helix-turn-helix (wHTH) protein
MVTICRYCGATTDCPQLFTLAAQRIFQFIWENPGSTVNEIISGLYAPRIIGKTQTVRVHIYRIRRVLADTEYQLLPYATNIKRPFHYKIIRRPIAEQTIEGTRNVSV